MKTIRTLHSIAIALVIAITSLSPVNAQKILPCATTEMTNAMLAKTPGLWEKYSQYETYTQNYVKNLEAAKLTKRAIKTKGPSLQDSAMKPTVYIIPLVFHILHQYGPEDISDAQIMDEMRILNEDYSLNNPDTDVIATPHFKSIAANMQIQFRLAQIDPNGNCTNGIDRIYTSATNNANDNSKLNQWDRTKYVNIWVVKSIRIADAEAAGYAYFPWEVQGDAAPIDGVLILNGYIGSIGTSSPLTSRALTHELGHVLNLEHPWGLTNSPGVACGGSGVTDVPETKGWDYCPVDTNHAKICDTVSKSPLFIVTENYQNYMDYSYCSVMFTEGQKEREWAALNSTVSGRNNLWDTANLYATGVLDYPSNTYNISTCTPIADFYSNTSVASNSNICFVCLGATIDFTDASWNAPTSWAWTFTGASANSSTLQNPSVTFDSLWNQTVSLTASNSNGSNTDTKWNYIIVSPLWTSFYGTFSDGFENPSEISNNWLFTNLFNDATNWQYTNTAASTGTGSLLLNSYSPITYTTNTDPAEVLSLGNGSGAVWDAITPSVNLQTASAMNLSFDYSCATMADDPTDILETLGIFYSLNCGQTWAPVKTITSTTLANAGNYSTYFTPSSPSDWSTLSIPLGTAINGKSNVRFKFEYTSGPNSNNIYLDNVNLTGTVGINELTAVNSSFNVYPNPTSGNVVVSYTLAGTHSVKVELTDVVGRNVGTLLNETQSDGQHNLNFNTDLSNGIYFVTLISDGKTISTRKLIITK